MSQYILINNIFLTSLSICFENWIFQHFCQHLECINIMYGIWIFHILTRTTLTSSTLCMLCNFLIFKFCRLLTFSKWTISKNLSGQHFQNGKQFGSRSDPMFWSGFNLFTKISSRWLNLPLTGRVKLGYVHFYGTSLNPLTLYIKGAPQMGTLATVKS